MQGGRLVSLNDSCVIHPGAKVRDSVRALEASPRRLAVVVDGAGRVIGAITDGDIRRGILAGHGLDSEVTSVMNANPLTADVESSEPYLLQLLNQHGLEAIPLVDVAGRFVRVAHFSELGEGYKGGGAEGFHAAVIMAGGEGRRLRPLTNDRPKPMIEVGGMPLLEHLVRSAVKAGLPRIYIAINYLRDQIESHFGDGSRFGVPIAYIREEHKLGTAGALSLLEYDLDGPLLVVNGDVLTTSDYSHMLRFHREHRATVSVGAVEYHVKIPYGVLEADGVLVTAVREKPSQRFLCNAGIYALSPEAMQLIPRGRFFDMPELISAVISGEGRVCIFPIHEYWTDIGNEADLARARADAAALEIGRV
jgi:dTDP-glucose pyrophosphorylase/CBS domain-containing protein